MAKVNNGKKATTPRRRPLHAVAVRKRISNVALLISSLPLTIPLLLLQTLRATQFPGQAQVVWASEVPENPPHSQLRPLLKQLQRLP